MIKISFDKLQSEQKKEMVKWCATRFGHSEPDPRGLVGDKRWTYDSVGPRLFFFFNNDYDHIMFALRWM